MTAATRPLLTPDELDTALHALTDQLESELHAAEDQLNRYTDQLATADRDIERIWTAALDLNTWAQSVTGTAGALETMTKALVRAAAP